MAQYTVKWNVAAISIDHPPVNAINLITRGHIFSCIQRAIKDSNVEAVVLCAKGKQFSAGSDIKEYVEYDTFPTLRQVVDRLESCSKPVIAALHGLTLGGGLEIALGCHYRIATSDTHVGFPEVLLGILPAAGGTQRFPRLAGIDAAMEWISGGKQYSADAAAKVGLFDRIVPPNANVVDMAVSFARTVAGKPLHSKRLSSIQVQDVENVEEIARKYMTRLNKKTRGQYAPGICIQAVKFGVQNSFEKGMAKEFELFKTLVTSSQSQALMYASFAERQIQKWRVPKTNITWENSTILPVRLGAVIGLGTMGTGIVINFLIAGIPVIVKEMNEKFLQSGIQSVHKIIDAMERHGTIDDRKNEMMKKSVTGTLDYSDLVNVDLVIEAVFEEADLKKKVFQALDKVCKPSTILASNTSAINIDEIANFTNRPDKVMGMHFFAPANLMRLLENINGAKTSAETIATCMDMGRRMRKVTVLVGNCHGFVGNRMYFNYMNEADYLLEEGAYPETVDKALTDYGFAMGRYVVGDLSGNDVGYRMCTAMGLTPKQQSSDTPERERNGMRYCPLSDYICEEGRYGIKVRKGWYDYMKRTPVPSVEVKKIIGDYRQRNSIIPKRIDAQEVLERTLYALINEGFRILDGGYSAAPWDVDMVWLHGYAWPRHTGGPMYYAFTVGLHKILKRIQYFHEKFGDSVPHWEPSDMLVRLVKKYGNPPMQLWMEESSSSTMSDIKSNL